MIAAILVGGGMFAALWFTAALRRLPAAEASVPPTISIVIPARDEADNLPRLLDSIAEVAPGAHEVIVVDDGSSDGTATVAARHGAIVIRLDGPPPGWAGKPYACARGAEAATGELLIFLDADVRLLPGALGRLVAAHSDAAGLVSVQPYHRVERPYEELSAMFNAVSMIGSAAFARWPSPRRPVAFGPCLVTSATDYRRVGGHERARADVVEDIALARAYRRLGLPVTCSVGAGAVEFRMYPHGIRQLLEGWTKNIVAGAGATDPVGLVAGIWFVAGCVAAATTPVVLLVGSAPVDGGDVVGATAMWLAVSLVLRTILRRIGSFGWSTALLHPVATGAFVVVFAHSAWCALVRGQVRWRGRAVAVGRSGTD